MKKYYNSLGAFIATSTILLSAVIFENIIGTQGALKNHSAQQPATTDGVPAGQLSQEQQNDRTVLYPPTTPQPAQVDVSSIKKAIEKAGLTPVEAHYWKEVE
jgi:hypothetical protein